MPQIIRNILRGSLHGVNKSNNASTVLVSTRLNDTISGRANVSTDTAGCNVNSSFAYLKPSLFLHKNPQQLVQTYCVSSVTNLTSTNDGLFVNPTKIQRHYSKHIQCSFYSTQKIGTTMADKDTIIKGSVVEDKNSTESARESISADMDSSRSKDDKTTTADETKPKELSRKDKLKLAVKEYGSTVIVFHVTISLASLGVCYALVSSGVDMTQILTTVGFSEESIGKLATKSGTFVAAYAIHKIFAPVRISITLGATPFIVRYLRQKGWIKKP